MTEANACEQLAQGCYLEADRLRFEPATLWIASERSTTGHTDIVWKAYLIVVGITTEYPH